MSHTAIISYAFFPLVLNLTLVANYHFSNGEYQETYRFERNYYQNHSRLGTSRGTEMSSKITLENDAYDHYYGIRIFSSQSKVKPTNRITYTFKTGLLGIPVMTDYRFH